METLTNNTNNTTKTSNTTTKGENSEDVLSNKSAASKNELFFKINNNSNTYNIQIKRINKSNTHFTLFIFKNSSATVYKQNYELAKLLHVNKKFEYIITCVDSLFIHLDENLKSKDTYSIEEDEQSRNFTIKLFLTVMGIKKETFILEISEANIKVSDPEQQEENQKILDERVIKLEKEIQDLEKIINCVSNQGELTSSFGEISINIIVNPIQEKQSLDKKEIQSFEYFKLDDYYKQPNESGLYTLKFEELNLLRSWVKFPFKVVPIFKATITANGFNTKTFHEKCHEKNNLLVIVSTKKFTRRFGAFTPLSFDNNKNGYFKPDKSFQTIIFSLDKSTCFNLKKGEERRAIRNEQIGPCFGNFDLAIKDSCNIKYNSIANLGYSFDISQLNCETDSEYAKTYLAGDKSFNVEELEVFQLEKC